ncbi:MAG: archease [Gemmatimonadota bacterium]
MRAEEGSVRGAGDAGMPPGVRELDHTADVGIRVAAASLDELFVRAVGGTWYLVFGQPEGLEIAEPGDDAGERAHDIRLHADRTDGLLLKWLQELLYLYEVDGFVARRFRFDTLTERDLDCRVWGGPSRREPVRDLKGVTYHGLEAKRTDDGWSARVIFDV